MRQLCAPELQAKSNEDRQVEWDGGGCHKNIERDKIAKGDCMLLGLA